MSRKIMEISYFTFSATSSGAVCSPRFTAIKKEGEKKGEEGKEKLSKKCFLPLTPVLVNIRLAEGGGGGKKKKKK